MAKKILVDERERIAVGIDVHKKTYYVAFWGRSADRLLGSWATGSEPEALADQLASFLRQIDTVVYEAGPTGFSLARYLREKGYPVDVISASHMLRAPGQKSKSDRLDCRIVAQHASKGLLHKVYVPTQEEEWDRQILRTREQMLKNRRRVRQQIKAFLLQHGLEEPAGLRGWSLQGIAALRAMSVCDQLRWALHVLLDELDHCEGQLKRAREAVRKLSQTKRHIEHTTNLETAPGVGLLTAMTVRTELPHPERFDNGRQIARMLGLSPEVRGSGETRHECGRGNGGNRRARSMLVEAAWRWIRYDPSARERYNRLMSNTGSAKKAIVGVARKLGIILWRMMTRGEAYRRPCVVATETK